MTASAATRQFIDQLRFNGVELWVEGDKLRYSAPKGLMTPDVLAELKQRKTDIMAALSAAQTTSKADAIKPIPRDGTLPLSFAQQRIWFLDELEPDNPFYNVTLAKRIRGRVDEARLRAALLDVINRHEVLRCYCETVDNAAVLHVDNAIMAAGDWFAVERLDRGIDEDELHRRVDAEGRRPVRLSAAPLIRARLFRITDTDAVLVLTTHHFVVDGWSCGLLMQELSTCYNARTAGTAPQLPDLPVQYADFAAWQNEFLHGPELERQSAYWKQQLHNLTTLNLPTDLPRPPVQTYRGDLYNFTLPGELLNALKGLSRELGVTLYMALLAGFQALLHRYSQQDDIVVGAAVSNRHVAALENLLGPFVNTLVLRGDLSGAPTYRELITRTRDTAAAAFAHQDLPFESLVEQLRPERDRSRSPLFQVLFVVHQYDADEELALTGCDCSDYPVKPGTTMYDLFLQLIELDGKLSGSIEYSTDLFTRDTIERLTSHLRVLLESAARNPDTPVERLPLMSATERSDVLQRWNRTASDYPRDQGLHELFEAQAAATPERVAVQFHDTELSYAELDARANRLAHTLIDAGVGRGDRVGIYLERDASLLVSTLGILKSGAAYVPLDPAFPEDRIAFMMSDAELAAVIVDTRQTARLPDTAIPRIDLDSSAIDNRPVTRPAVAIAATDLAYMIYTSGSTGLPKGVQLPHRAVVNFLCSMREAPGLRPDDVLVAVTTLSFDIAVLELFLPLVTGARVVIADRDTGSDGVRLAALIDAAGATVMQATPATWRLLLNEDWQGRPGLKVLCGGEALPRNLADRLLAAGAELWNMYGPTETTIWSSVSKVATTGPVTVGKPIANTQMYILDEQLEPAPLGVPGELCIGGDGLAVGYFKRDELTAEKFIANPFGDGRIYRTGDLARYLPDGDIECLGRTDYQIKIRGFRMELGEIEAALTAHPAVKEAAVTAHEYREGDTRLIAYVVTDESGISEAQLQQWTAEHLEQWKGLWEGAYVEGSAEHDPRFNIAGWNSSYTGAPIPAAEMRAWVEATAARIKALQARDVLEIGAGTGLFVAQVAPHTSSYLATDFSPAAIEAVSRLRAEYDDLAHVETLQAAADRLDAVAERSRDLVILNSVAQYFPDADYLRRVLLSAVDKVADGGHVFAGDIRDFNLLQSYHTSVQLFQSDGTTTLEQLGQTIRQRMDQEEELLLAPEFFARLPLANPRITGVSFRLKEGRERNELSAFRYDVVLHVGGSGLHTAKPDDVDWQSAGLDLDALSMRLTSVTDDGLRVSGIPDARLVAETRLAALLQEQPGISVAEARVRLQQAPPGIEPAELFSLAGQAGLSMEAVSGRPGYINAWFRPADSTAVNGLVRAGRDAGVANDPMQGRLQRSLVPELRDSLKKRLPDYMVPGVYAVLDAFPLTPNGKVDRKALPVPDGQLTQTYAPPESDIEKALVAVFEDILSLGQVGIDDDFFELGGHSLLATQLISRVRAALGVRLPLNALFETPTVRGMAVTVASMEPGTAAAAEDVIPVADRAADLPSSFAQQRLWFLDALEPGTPLYNMPFVSRIHGEPDIDLLAQALQEMAARHETLRTRFESVAGVPVQRIDADVRLPLQQQRVKDAAELDSALQELAQASFNLASAPLLRATLLTIDDSEHALALVFHHIIADLWSVDVFLRELSACYAALSEHRAPGLPAMTLHYADYAAWQRRVLSGERLQQHLDFWTAELAGAPEVLDLPTDYPRPAEPTYRGAWQEALLPADLTDKLRALAASSTTTPYMLFLAAFNVLLSRYSGSNDIVIGTPVAGRDRQELESLLGFFLNTLVVRTELDPAAAFTAALATLRQRNLASREHQALPFERLVEELQPERDMSVSPVFQVMFVWQEATDRGIRIPGLAIEGAELIGQGTAKFDLTLFVADKGDHFSVGIEYATDLFSAQTIARMLAHFRTLLDAIVANPACPVGQLPLLSAAEREQQLGELSGKTAAYPASTVAELVAAQVSRTPAAIALTDGQTTLSYRELDEHAGRLAAHLRAGGLQTGDTVAVCGSRSATTAIAAYAVIKAGGNYTPLDPEYPAERLAYMLGDCAPSWLLTESALAGRLPAGTAQIVALDEFDFTAGEVLADPLTLGADDPLYTIYTSGSTGQPKGVVLPQRTIANLSQWQTATTRLAAPARTLQFAPASFDVHVQELFTTWASGGTLVMVDSDTRRDMPRLAAFIAAQDIERVYLPFAALRPLAEAALDNTDLHFALRDVVVAGEQLQITPAIRAWFTGLTDCRLHNQYGPSETHVVTALTLDSDPSGWPRLPSIGTPVANCRVYVLDTNRQPVPLGASGELCLGGAQVALGYLNRPELTAEKFIADTFGDGALLYRTGDRVRFGADGTLQFLGRIDDQVKFRGFRIEPGEIASALTEHPAVAQATVMLREDVPGVKQLVGYVVAPDDAGLGDTLRRQLKERLPDYMVPAAIVCMEAFPLTPSGKVNTRALPPPDLSGALADNYVAPVTPEETALTEIWAAVLGLERAGVQDDFFALGGHSLLATQLLSRVREALQFNVPLKYLFRYPTPGELAAMIVTLKAAAEPAAATDGEHDEFTL